MSIYHLDALVAPKSVAVIGASPRERSLGRIALRNLREGGFTHPITPSWCAPTSGAAESDGC